MKEKLRNKNWYAYTVALCTAVVLYVVLTHLGQINTHLGKFYGYFNTVVLGLILAYLMNPLAKFFQKKVLSRAGKLGESWTVAALLAVITTLIFFIFMLDIFIPQLIESIRTFMGNLDTYAASMDRFLSKQGASGLVRKAALREQVANINGKIIMYLAANAEAVINASAAAGKALLKWVIAFILSVYMLMAKSSLKKGAKRIMRAIMPEKTFVSTMDYLKRCNAILVDYIVCSLFDSLIVGGITAIFMTITGMEYVGMISLLVAVTNLIPNFGPLIGGAIGAFILLLVDPVDAITFVLFVLVLQFLDGYVIKPRLFGNKLGVSGLLILASVVVCGNIWGITGILLAIPIAAILDFTMRDVILPELERRRGIKAEETEETEEITE